jgi:hypothetical protein
MGGFALVGTKVWAIQRGDPKVAGPAFSVFDLDGTIDTPYIGAGYGGDNTGARQLRLGPDNNLYLLANTPTTDIRKHDSTTGAYIDTLITGLPGNAQSFDFGPDGNVYVSDYDANKVEKYNGSTGAFMSTFVTMPNTGPGDVFFGADANDDTVSDLYASDTQGSRTVEIFDGTNGAHIASLTTPNDPQAKPARIATSTGSVRVWASVTGNESVIYWDYPPAGENDAQLSGLGDYPLAIMILPEQVIPPTPKNPGDVDEDDFVGGADLTQILTNWGDSGVSWTDGDVDPYNDGITTGDDFIGGGDYTEVLTFWGASYGPEAIPEPATIGLLLAGLGLLLRKR